MPQELDDTGAAEPGPHEDAAALAAPPAAATMAAAAPAGVRPAAAVPATKPPPAAASLLKALLLIALVATFKVAQPLLVPIAVAVILTFVLTPAVRWLHRRGIVDYIGAGLVVAALVAGIALVGLTLSEPVSRWIERAPNTMERLVARLDRIRASVPLLAPPPQPAEPAPRVGSRSAPVPGAEPAPTPPPPRDPLKEKVAAETMALTGEFVGGSVTFAISAVATLILLYFMLASEYWMLSRTVEAIQRRRTRALLLSGVRAAQTDISHYLGAMAVINLAVGAATAAVMWALGLDSPALWGALAAVLNFVPYIGPLVMAVLLLVAGLLTFDSTGLVFVPALAFLAVHFVEANFVTPTFVGRRLTLAPVAVFLAVMFMAWLWGIAGAVIAVPLLVGLRAVSKRNRRWRLLAVYLEGAHNEVASLRSLVRIRRRAPVRRRTSG